MTRIEFELPYLPVSENEAKTPLIIHGVARLVKSAKARKFSARVQRDLEHMGKLPPQPLEGPVEIKLAFTFESIASDGSNRIKSIEDALTESGMWHDDKQVSCGGWLKLVGNAPSTKVVITAHEDAQGELVARLAESRKNRQRKVAKAAQLDLGALAAPAVVRFRR